MKTAEVNALRTRFKSTFLLLMAAKLDEIEDIDKGIIIAQRCFDGGDYESCKKALDICDSIILDILEVPEINLN